MYQARNHRTDPLPSRSPTNGILSCVVWTCQLRSMASEFPIGRWRVPTKLLCELWGKFFKPLQVRSYVRRGDWVIQRSWSESSNDYSWALSVLVCLISGSGSWLWIEGTMLYSAWYNVDHWSVHTHQYIVKDYQSAHWSARSQSVAWYTYI